MTRRPADWDDDERTRLEPALADVDALGVRHQHDMPVGVLRAAGTGALPEALDGSAQAALASSPWSRALIESVDQASPALDPESEARLFARIRPLSPDAPRPQWSRWWTWGPLLSVAAAVTLFVVVEWTRTPPPAARGGAQTGAPAAASRAPVFKLPLDKPDVRLTSMALVMRRPGQSGTFLDDVAPALNAFRAGDYKTAAAEFTRVQPKYATAVEIPFYLGVSRLFLDDATGAVAALQDARRLADETFRADVAWYLAVADERAGDVAGAKAELKALCAGKSPYAARACQAAARF